MCYLHLLCRQWSYLRLWLSRKAGTGAAPASGPVFSGPATRRTLLGDNCCSQLKIVSTQPAPPTPAPPSLSRGHVSRIRVSRDNTRVAAGYRHQQGRCGDTDSSLRSPGHRDSDWVSGASCHTGAGAGQRGGELATKLRGIIQFSQYSEIEGPD